jgi:hypothetical protein
LRSRRPDREISGGTRADGNIACWPSKKPWVGPVFGQTCPSWQFNTHGWLADKYWGKDVGFDLQVADSANGLKLTLADNAQGLPNTSPLWSDGTKVYPDGEVCSFRETTVTYEYKPGALKRMPLLNERLKFSYNAKISAPGAYNCASEKRAILTSDILWTTPNPIFKRGWVNPSEWTDGKDDPATRDPDLVHALSVVHYNPSNWTTGGAVPRNKVLWTNDCKAVDGHNVTYKAGCRVTVAARDGYIGSDATTPISDDFTALAAKYKDYLNDYVGYDPAHPIDPHATVRSVQIVTSNKGTNTTAVLDSIDLRAGS